MYLYLVVSTSFGQIRMKDRYQKKKQTCGVVVGFDGDGGSFKPCLSSLVIP